MAYTEEDEYYNENCLVCTTALKERKDHQLINQWGKKRVYSFLEEHTKKWHQKGRREKGDAWLAKHKLDTTKVLTNEGELLNMGATDV